jgi:hypothetical protein
MPSSVAGNEKVVEIIDAPGRLGEYFYKKSDSPGEGVPWLPGR